ncbi:MAG: SIMPL domain-containing protein [Spirulina sp. SIO3F2]|nr:SIMPL domain-containing protein [Spirulina sp. SIO3F2]
MKALTRSLGVLGLSVALGGSMPLMALAQEAPQRILSVTGSATVSVPTTITRVRLAIDVRDDNAADVQVQVAERTQAVVRLLRSRGVERMQTTGIRLQPRYERNTDDPQLIGYSGSNSVAFRIATDRAGALIDDAIQVGATRIDGVEFLATEAELEQARLEALRLATQNAQSQANAVLSALGLTIQEVVSIDLGQTRALSPIQSNALVVDAATSPIVGGDSTVQGTVTLRVRY